MRGRRVTVESTEASTTDKLITILRDYEGHLANPRIASFVVVLEEGD